MYIVNFCRTYAIILLFWKVVCSKTVPENPNAGDKLRNIIIDGQSKLIDTSIYQYLMDLKNISNTKYKQLFYMNNNSLNTKPNKTQEDLLHETLLTLCYILILSLITYYYINFMFNFYISLPCVSIFYGIITGYILNSYYRKGLITLKFMESLYANIFPLVLYPTIALHNGMLFAMAHKQLIITNLGMVVLFSVMTTFISFLLIGSFTFLLSKAHFFTLFSLKESFIFGALISSSDPIALLSFIRSSALPELFQLFISGESLINDGLTISVYHTLTDNLTLGYLQCFYMFIYDLLIPIIIGFGFSLFSYIIHRFIKIYHEGYQIIEIVQFFVCCFCSYLAADNISQTGMIAVLIYVVFTGFYTFRHFSPHGVRVTQEVTKLLYIVCESVSFTVIGLVLINNVSLFNLNLIVFCICIYLIIFLSRILSVFVSCSIINLLSGDTKLPYMSQQVMSLCGIQGILTFILVLNARKSFSNQLGVTILNTTLFLIVFNTFFSNLVLFKLIRLIVRNKTVESHKIEELQCLQPSPAHGVGDPMLYEANTFDENLVEMKNTTLPLHSLNLKSDNDSQIKEDSYEMKYVPLLPFADNLEETIS